MENLNLHAFTIKVNNRTYYIQPDCAVDCTNYEVSTHCEKLFTLKLSADGTWTAVEEDVVAISENLFNDIGEAILKHQQYGT